MVGCTGVHHCGGFSYIDYMVSDTQCVPSTPEFTQHYSEKMLYMPHTYFPNDHKQSAVDVLDPDKCLTRDRFAIPEDKFVFCCFNQMCVVLSAHSRHTTVRLSPPVLSPSSLPALSHLPDSLTSTASWACT